MLGGKHGQLFFDYISRYIVPIFSSKSMLFFLQMISTFPLITLLTYGSHLEFITCLFTQVEDLMMSVNNNIRGAPPFFATLFSFFTVVD